MMINLMRMMYEDDDHSVDEDNDNNHNNDDHDYDDHDEDGYLARYSLRVHTFARKDL